MANICITNYACKGSKENIESLKEALQAVRNPEDPGDWMPWAGEFLKNLGYDPNETLDRCGWIHNGDGTITVSDDGTRLNFMTESKWARCECLERVLAEKFKVKVYFIEEELGCDIFCTNDTAHELFPEYIIIDSDEDGMHYCTDDEARDLLKELIGDREETAGKVIVTMSLEEISRFLEENFDDIWMHVAQAA